MVLSRFVALAAVLALLAGCQTEAPTFQEDGELSYDGLRKVKNSRLKLAWAKPDTDLTGYSKIRLIGAGIEYRAVKPLAGASRMTSSRTDFPLDAEQRGRLEKTAREVFIEELSKSKYFTLVNEEGPDVLEIKGALLDVVSTVPPQPVGRGDIYLSKIGEATLVLEIRDSESNEILARGVERRSIEPVFAIRSSKPTNASEVRRALRKWATILTTALDSFHEDYAS